MEIKKSLVLLASCGLLLAGCGDSGSSKADEAPKDTTSQVSSNKDTSNDNVDDTSAEVEEETEVAESEIGSMEKLGSIKDLNETQESGPFKVTIEAVQKGQLKTAEDYVELMGGEDLAVITIKLKIEHDSEDTDVIYPNQGTVVTNTKKQVEADIVFSDDIGGDFIGKVDKEGEVIFLFDDNAKDITNFKYVIGSGSDENYENFSDDLVFEFEF